MLASSEKDVSIHQINEEARLNSTIPERNVAHDHEGQLGALLLHWSHQRGLICALIHAN